MSGINLLAGAWLAVAPWLLGYWTSDPRWNDIACGAVVGAFAFARATAPFRAARLSWINALIGAWLFVAAFTIDRSPIATWNDAIVGGAVFVLAIGSATATSSLVRRRRSGPWGR